MVGVVVVLDAQNGDLLTSANYPRPDYQRLRDEDHAGIRYYNDYRHPADWKGYTDRDLGLTYQSMPGSTAKVMSALAGLQKMGISAAGKKYYVDDKEIVENGRVKEPHGYDVTMRDAIVKSSNCYFINLVNDCELYQNLGDIYETVGVRIENVTPYYLSYSINSSKHSQFQNIIQEVGDRGVEKYRQYKEGGEPRIMNDKDWQWAWGQGTMTATPLNMARVVSAVANGGQMPVTHYLRQTADQQHKNITPEYVSITSSANAKMLKYYLREQAANNQSIFGAFTEYIGGKTGTPERTLVKSSGKRSKPNDGWYVMYVETGTAHHPVLAVALRMERVGLSKKIDGASETSGAAMRMANEVVLSTLEKRGYIVR